MIDPAARGTSAKMQISGRLCLTLVLGLSACKTPQSGDELADTETGDGDGDTVGFAAGNRLHPIVLTAESGATALVGWYDSQLQTECAFFPDGDGVQRCMPFEREHPDYDPPEIYGDPGCTIEVTINRCTASTSYAIGHVQDPCVPYMQVRPVVGELEEGPVYQRTQEGECTQQDASVPRAQLGEVMDSSEFVAAWDEISVGDARILGVRKVAEDGSWSYVGAWDEVFSDHVRDAVTSDGQRRWLPLAPEIDPLVFVDDGCTQPVAHDHAYCPPDYASYTAEVETDACGATTTIHEGGPTLTQLHAWNEDGSMCLPSGSQPNGWYPVGPALEDGAFAEVEIVFEGEGQIQVGRLAESGGSPLGFAQWFDTVHQQACVPARDSEGVVRCLPAAQSFYTTLYLDPTCAGEPVAAFDPCHSPPPPYVTELVSFDEECPVPSARNLVRAIAAPIDPAQTAFHYRDGESCFAFEIPPQYFGYSFYETSVVDPAEFAALVETTL
jgi:hypothetical protein